MIGYVLAQIFLAKRWGGGGCKKLKHVICSAFLRVIILIFEYFL